MPILLGALVQSGCGDDSPTGSNPPGDPVREFWQGTYVSTDLSDRGSLIVDIVRTGSEATGEAVFRSRNGSSPFDHLFVKGTAGGSQLQLGPNTDLIDYQYQFAFTATAMSDSDLTGTFTYSPTNLSADIVCRKLPVGTLTVEWGLDMTEGVYGLAYDGEHIWASTLSDYMLLDADGAVVDRVSVTFRSNTLWTSDALTSDGISLWGHLPETVLDSTGTHNRSLIIEFAKNGTIKNQYEIPHRTSGLASGGGELWSLPLESDGLYRFDDTGSILETVDVEVPDLADLEYDGTSFWAIGWFLDRLYRIDRTGTVLRVYDLPTISGIVFPSAIAYDGTSFWYSVGNFALDSRLYKLHLDP